MIFTLYRIFFAPLAFVFLLFISIVNRKVREGLRLRLARYRFTRSAVKAWGRVWIHCASGEFEYAKPVIRALKAQSSDIQIVVSYFSPSYRTSIEAFSL